MIVAFLANTGWYVNNFRRSTVSSFISQNSEVVIICPENSGEDLLKDLDVKVLTFKLDGSGTNPIKEVISLAQIFWIIRKVKADIVFSFNPKTNLYSLFACKFLCVPCVPNISGVGTASQLQGLVGIIYRSMCSMIYKFSKFIFFQNEDDLQDFKMRGYVESVEYLKIPGSGVDLEKFVSSGRVRNNRCTFILASRLIEQKGVYEYIKAAKRIRLLRSDCEFLLAGIEDKSSRAISKKIIEEAVENGFIKYLGHVTDISRVLRDVDCVVLPSFYPEGVPRILLEGAASGKILVTTEKPGCKDVVVENKNGFFVEPKSVESLASAFQKVIDLSVEESERMGNFSRRLAENRFDEKTVIRAYLEVADKFGR